MKSDFAVGVAPDKPDRQAAPQLAAGRLVADPAVEAGPKDIKFRFALVPFSPSRRRSLNNAGW